MTNVLLIVSLVAAAGLCPLMMWWNARRGRASACCAPTRTDAETPTAAELRGRLQDLDARIAEHADDAGRGTPAGHPS